MDEYIEREAAIKEAIAERDLHSPFTPELSGWRVGAEKVANRLASIPAADVKPTVRGKWEWDINGMDWNIGAWICSHCHTRPETWWATVGNVHPLLCSGSRFCGNCGADMRTPAGEQA